MSNMLSDVMESFELLAKSDTAREITKRFATNYVTGKPFFASLLVTSACQANCDFCQFRRDNYELDREKPAESYADILEPLNLPMLSFIGGEPLLRKDLPKLVKEAKKELKIPFVHVVTNGEMLNQETYGKLEAQGLDELVVSIDFASSEHSKSRGLDGLYDHLTQTIPTLNGRTKIRINSILMKDNLVGENPKNDVRGLIGLAEQLGVTITFGAYSPMRNNNKVHQPGENEVVALNNTLQVLLDAHERGTVLSARKYLTNAVEYLKGNEIENCQAGKRFLWITPDKKFMPCQDYAGFRYDTLEEAQKFPIAKDCTSCYADCRGTPELLGSKNPFTVLDVVGDIKRAIQ